MIAAILLAAAALAAPVHVDAAAGWTGTGVAAAAGDVVDVSAVGLAFTTRPDAATTNAYFHPNPGSGRAGASGPAGQPYVCTSWDAGTCLVENAPFGALVGRIGTATFVVGDAPSFVAPASGVLELAVNDAAEWLFDNSGGYTVALTEEGT